MVTAITRRVGSTRKPEQYWAHPAGGFSLDGVCHHADPNMLGPDEYATDMDASIKQDIALLPCSNPAHVADGAGDIDHGGGLGCLIGGAMAASPAYAAGDPASWVSTGTVRLQRLLGHVPGAVQARE